MSSQKYTVDLEPALIRVLPPDQQRAVMESWFRSKYENPAVRTPYDSEDGDYVWIWGGPFDALDELRTEFDGVVPDDVIEALANDLSSDCDEWAPVESDDDYDHELLEVITSSRDPRADLHESLQIVSRLLLQPGDHDLAAPLHRLLYANLISVLEAYLSDSFINQVLTDPQRLRQFVETTPDFQKRPVRFSEVFRIVDGALNEVKRHLLAVVWHDLGKVQAMYRHTLGIDLRRRLADLARAVAKRHDIVHRNGRNKSGDVVEVSSDDVRGLITLIEDCVSDIENQRRNQRRDDF
jgi:hypothetical protein